MARKAVRKRFVQKKRHKPGVPTFADYASTADSYNDDAEGSSPDDPDEITDHSSLPFVSPERGGDMSSNPPIYIIVESQPPNPISTSEELPPPSVISQSDGLLGLESSDGMGAMNSPENSPVCIVIESEPPNPTSTCEELPPPSVFSQSDGLLGLESSDGMGAMDSPENSPICIVIESQQPNPMSTCEELSPPLVILECKGDMSTPENPPVCNFTESQLNPEPKPNSTCIQSQSEVTGNDTTSSTTPKCRPKQGKGIPDWIPPKAVLLEAKFKIEQFLPKFHHVLLHQDNSLHVVLVSRTNNLSIQRTIVLYASGDIAFFVHRKELSVKAYLDKELPPALLESDTVDYFVDRSVKVIQNISKMEICSGYDNEDFKAAWSSCSTFGKVEGNEFDECRYEETFRSNKCEMLVTNRQWRCRSCKKLYLPLRRRTLALANEELSPFAHNTKMSEEQKLKKMAELHRELRNERKKNARLREKMDELIEQQGVQVDAELAGDLMEILNEADLTPAQSIFLQQQIKASQKKNMVGMRWHPTMIRLALALYTTSPAAYELLRDSGMVKLPSGRTLFDYSHVKPVNDGIDKVVLESLGERVSKLDPKNSYFVLMADEMHIYGNLVMQKSTGKIVGYKKLDDLDKEVEVLNQYLDNPQEDVKEILASKILVYMVKGVSAGIKEVVATFPVSNPSAQQMYSWTWKVIGALERSGLKIIAFICDGFSTNRAFIKMHKPATVLPNGLIFDTINKAAPDRKLYFISDVPHLLKTIRNCFMNSRWDKKKGRRHMRYKGKKITWDFLVKLYETQKGKNLRKSFKLNAMNVYPDSYARMKVLYAGQAVSNTVAQDIEDKKWPGTSETVYFIRLFNDWFDCLNGPHSLTGKRKRNPNLNPYTTDVLGDDPKDKRFQFLDSVLDYLNSWKEDTKKKNPNESVNTSVDASVLGDAEADESEIFEGSDDECEDDTPAAKRILSRETLEGIEMSTRSIKAAITFLLKEGVNYINPRIFTQDPLEQHFSKIRAGQGGSNNPNYYQALNRNRALHTIGQLGVKKRKGNSGECASSMVVTTEKLAKRKCHRGPKFDL